VTAAESNLLLLLLLLLLLESCATMVQMSAKDQLVVKALPGNTACCDCGMKNPQWASVSFGNVFCLECSGVHRYVRMKTKRTNHRQQPLDRPISSLAHSLVFSW
jgi:Putative GTPase activating protein for Arf